MDKLSNYSFKKKIILSKKTETYFFIILGLSVLLFQAFKTGFEPGHHGWVSSHGLAIISRATIENNFVGYSQDLITEDGIREYDYFDRYPILFSASMQTILSPLAENLSWHVYSARQLMNIIYIFTLIFFYKILLLLTKNRNLSMSISLLIFSSQFFMAYKSMVHFDQPALLGMVLLIYAIVKYKRTNQNKSFLIFISILAPLLGRGYVNNFILLTWFAYEFFIFIKNKFQFNSHFRMSAVSLFLGGIIGISFLGYNIYTEAKKRDVEFTQTSILRSAFSRTGVKETYGKKKLEQARLYNFIPNQIDRFKDGFSPYFLYSTRYNDRSDPAWKKVLSQTPYELVSAIIFLFSLWQFYKKRELFQNSRNIWFIFIFGGIIWLFIMRRLAVYHDYTAIYYIGGYAFLYAHMVYSFRFKRRKILYISIMLFYISLTANSIHELKVAQEKNIVTKDFQKIKNYIKQKKDVTIYFEKDARSFLKSIPYARQYYLSGTPEALDKKYANFFITMKNIDNSSAIDLMTEKFFLGKTKKRVRSKF